MKKIVSLCFFLVAAVTFLGCKKDSYPGGTPYNVISLLDLKGLYNGNPITLTNKDLFGGDRIAAVVVSDFSAGNSPQGLVMVQEKRRLNLLRGITLNLGAAAGNYHPGDSLEIIVEGAQLTRENGVLQIKGLTTENIKVISSGNAIDIPLVKSSQIINRPQDFESTLLTIVKASFDGSYPPGTTYAGNKTINDGFGNVTLHTEAGAPWANSAAPFLSNFTGIVYTPASDTVPQLWPRTLNDITVLAATAPKVAPLIITGYLADPTGSDANYEYIQLMATKDLNFATKNFSVVTTNNAGSATPTGFPENGWATGGLRTYKINITTGSVTRGQYIYVGANKNIWGAGSTDISSAFWVSKMYATLAGDGFGTATSNLLANSGNAGGIAVFDLTAVTADTIPVDVMFYGGTGSLYSAGPPEKGYKITNTDYYDVVNPSTQVSQKYFAMGSNTGKLGFAAATYFSKLGGTYNTTTGRWTSARSLNGTALSASSTLQEIEGLTMLEQ